MRTFYAARPAKYRPSADDHNCSASASAQSMPGCPADGDLDPGAAGRADDGQRHAGLRGQRFERRPLVRAPPTRRPGRRLRRTAPPSSSTARPARRPASPPTGRCRRCRTHTRRASPPDHRRNSRARIRSGGAPPPRPARRSARARVPRSSARRIARDQAVNGFRGTRCRRGCRRHRRAARSSRPVLAEDRVPACRPHLL